MSTRLTYRFGPVERHGIFGAVRPGQALVVALGLAAAAAVLDHSPTAGGAFASTLLFAAAVLMATIPVGSRTAEEWLPITIAFGSRVARRRTSFVSPAPTHGLRINAVRGDRARMEHPLPYPPPSLRDLTVSSAEHGNRTVGVASSDRGRRLTSVLACRASSFALLDAEVQERRLARWGLVLSGAQAGPIRRLQWIERTVPAQGDELIRWLHSERDPAVPLRGTAMVDSYLELLDATASVTHEHEILLALQVDARRVRDRGANAAARALVEQTERVAHGLRAAEVNVLGALGPGQLARVLRTAFDPFAAAELAALASADRGRSALPASSAFPLGAREAWDHYRTDGALHATYWIGGWPRVEVSAMFMDALLGRSSAVRTVAVTFDPVPADRSTREVEAAVTRDRAERELRHRFGQSQTARQRQAEEATVRREAELAAGHGEVRFAGYVTVTGRDEDDLRRACMEVAEHAARARLELHRMYGQQADAFTFTLPLCRGLR